MNQNIWLLAEGEHTRECCGSGLNWHQGRHLEEGSGRALGYYVIGNARNHSEGIAKE